MSQERPKWSKENRGERQISDVLASEVKRAIYEKLVETKSEKRAKQIATRIVRYLNPQGVRIEVNKNNRRKNIVYYFMAEQIENLLSIKPLERRYSPEKFHPLKNEEQLRVSQEVFRELIRKK